jgi:hypothetical protein
MKIRNNSKSGAMRGYKDDELAARLKKAASARSAILEKFRAKPSADEPAEIERRVARQKISEARDLRAAERKSARLAEDAREAAERTDRRRQRTLSGSPVNSRTPWRESFTEQDRRLSGMLAMRPGRRGRDFDETETE